MWNSAFPEVTSPRTYPRPLPPNNPSPADLVLQVVLTPCLLTVVEVGFGALLSQKLRFVRVRGHLTGHLITDSPLWDRPQNFPRVARTWD